MATTDTPATTGAAEYFLEDVSTFDESRVVIHDPVTRSFKAGATDIENTTSDGRYLDDEGNECVLLFPGLPQRCFGVSYTYPIGLSEDDQTPDKAKGFQVCYPLTSLSTVNKPTPAEQAQLDLFTGLWNAAVAKGQEEAAREGDELLIPQCSQSSFLAASNKKKWENAVKVPFEYPKTKDKKTLDKTKPLRMYAKLVKSGEGNKLKALTPFTGPGDKKYNAVRYINKQGIITPVFRWSGIYWGAHGRTPCGASLKFEIVEALFVPVESTSLPSRRFLGPNTAPLQEGDDDEDEAPRPRSKSRAAHAAAADPEEDDGEDEFAEPGSDAAKPVAALSKAASKKPTSSLAKPAAKAGSKPSAAKPAGKVVASSKAGVVKPAASKAASAAKPAAPKAGAKPASKASSTAKPAAAKAKPAPKKPTPPVVDPEEDEDEESGDDVEEGSAEE